MKHRPFVYFLLIGALSAFSAFSYAEEVATPLDFQKNDRVLILAPHPDDETIGTGGTIQKALQAGAKVRVVCYTCGDHNELAFLMYAKRLVFKKTGFVYMGEVRKKETRAAMSSFGIPEEDIIFLGYPDFGTMEILTKYWDERKPYKSMLTRISKVPYKDALSYGAAYAGESILRDLKTVVRDFRPTKIFVSHPADTNRDHRALYLFLKAALWDLGSKINYPDIFPYIVHIAGWPKPRGYHAHLSLIPPDRLTDISWVSLALDSDQIKKKRDATDFYKSQISYNSAYLLTFVRKNELFGDFPNVILKKQTAHELVWQDLETNSSLDGMYEAQQEYLDAGISGLAYAYTGDHVCVKVSFSKRAMGGAVGMGIYLLGYKKGRVFSKMPKLYISVDNRGVRVRDKKARLRVKGVESQHAGRTLIVKIPVSLLGNPDYILSNIRSQKEDLPLSDLAWRVMVLED